MARARGLGARLIWGAVGVALVVPGITAVGLSYREARPSPKLLGGNLPVNRTALDRNNLTANNSPAVAANPTNAANLAAVNRIDAPEFSCALNVSQDGGASWAPTPFPPPPGPKASCLAPDLAWGADGTLFVSLTSYAALPGSGLDPAGIFLMSSRDGGRSLSAPVQVGGPFAFDVRLLADPASAHRLYLTWVQARATAGAGFTGDGNPIVLSRSDDGGATWSPPVPVTPAGRRRPLAPALAAGRSDELYLSYLDLRDDSLDYLGAHLGRGGEPYPGPWSLVVARSHDGGRSWDEAVAEPSLVPTRRLVDLFAPTPSLAVDRSGGQVYVGFEDARLGDPDVYVWTSSDGGRAWSHATRVNDTREHDGTFQYLPALEVAPNGRLDVLYYDRRRDPRDVLNETSLQSSYDHGGTFSPRLALSEGAFDSKIGFGSDRDLPELGSRLALVSTDARALALWCDTRGGVRATRKQDIGQAIVDFPQPFPPTTALRYGGVALIAAGLLPLALAVLPGRRRTTPGEHA